VPPSHTTPGYASPADVSRPRVCDLRTLLLLAASDCGLGDYLRRHGYRTIVVGQLDCAVRAVAGQTIEVVIMDGAMGADAVMRACAVIGARIDLIVLTPIGCGELGLTALEGGAADFVAAPHNPREVLARVRALLRGRKRPTGVDRRLTETLVLHGVRHQLSDGQRSVVLTPAQYRLLDTLAARPGQVLSRSVLLEFVYDDPWNHSDRAIDVLVCRVRRRLASVEAPDLIASYRGVGYFLDDARGGRGGRMRREPPLRHALF